MAFRLGELLVKRGVMTVAQCEAVLHAQQTQRRPFGTLAEEMFHVSPKALEDAWAEQYGSITARIDPRSERIEPGVVSTLSRRQAWQFRLLPIRHDGAELMICTTERALARALRFAYQHYGPSCYFVLAEPGHLNEALQRHYPMEGAHEHAREQDTAPAAPGAR